MITPHQDLGRGRVDVLAGEAVLVELDSHPGRERVGVRGQVEVDAVVEPRHAVAGAGADLAAGQVESLRPGQGKSR
eukprot:SAG22_NODE_668_length_7998_cov_4.353462_4_plen_76_part_00